MTCQLQIDKNSFQFHIIYIGMNPLKAEAATRTSKEVQVIRRSTLTSTTVGKRRWGRFITSSAV